MNLQYLKKCPMCEFIWTTRAELLDDPEVELIGYQANFKHLETGLFLFNHLLCKGTFAIQAKEFSDLYTGPVYNNSLFGSDFCLGYCLDQGNLHACSRSCEYAYIREIMQIIKNWPGRKKLEIVPLVQDK